MQFTKTGIILNTQNYQECVRFYGDVLGLEILYKIDRTDEHLTTFRLGNTYLMVERGGVAHQGSKTTDVCPTKFRFNVADINAACAELQSKGIDVSLKQHSWGDTAEFFDPDGNRCALRTDKGFGE